mmetsp:Transcript_42192/g.68489  ORF Transcript_42192/g.68489 Transcript_42192/m.68489 type:complete len:344 (+) Transcript_42192:29-1060(+)
MDPPLAPPSGNEGDITGTKGAATMSDERGGGRPDPNQHSSSSEPSENKNEGTESEATWKQRYHSAQYWDSRYEGCSEGSFDWYTDYAALAPLFRYYLREDSTVLNVGCGNSAVSEDLAMAGYPNVTSIDISAKCVELMEKRCRAVEDKEGRLKALRFMEMDASDLKFPDNTFHMCFEKGTIDALICDSKQNTPAIRKMIREAWRVLRPGGVFVVITYGAPKHRIKFFKNVDKNTCGKEATPWAITVRRVPYSPSALLIRHLRLALNGKPLRSVTGKMLAEAMSKVREDTERFETAEDEGPEGSVFCYAYCCTKTEDAAVVQVLDKSAPQQPKKEVNDGHDPKL